MTGSVVRGALAVTLAGALAVGAAPLVTQPLEAQGTTVSYAPAPVPFAVGEELVYRASFGGVTAGTARMRVAGIEMVRGRP
ncbi:MAG TPA: hypothetical protein VGE02_13970, partial [Gemmatimonadales bacterium]